MKPIISILLVDAPLELVFATIADISQYSKAVPHIKQVEFLSEQQTGVGARFRETRLMGDKETSTVLEVTEYVDHDRIRMISDEGGTIWDSVFHVADKNGGTELKLQMDIRPYKLWSKLLMPLVRSKIAGAVGQDLVCVKTYCESEMHPQ